MKKYLQIDFKLSLLNFRMYSIYYNSKVKESSKQLKPEHESYYIALLHQTVAQLDEANKTGNPIKDAKVYANSVTSSGATRRSSRTIRNYNERLCEAGVFTKVFHSRKRNYEIIHNPFLVPVFDLNANERENMYFSGDAVATAFLNAFLGKKFPHINYLLRLFNNQLKAESHNNKIFDNNSDKIIEKTETNYPYINSVEDYCEMLKCFDYVGVKTCKDICIDNCQDTGKGVAGEATKDIPPAKNPEKQPENAPKPAAKTAKRVNILEKIKSEHMFKVIRKSNIEELRYVYAYILYNYALTKIPDWKDSVYPSTAENVIVFLAENYFQNFSTKAGLDKFLLQYQETIDISARIIRKRLYANKWTKYWTFPETYFSLTYENGFVKAYQYWKEKQKLKEKYSINKQRIEINQKLNAIILEYYERPSKNMYFELLQRVKNTIPSREKQFTFCIKNNIHEIANYYQSKNNSYEYKAM